MPAGDSNRTWFPEIVNQLKEEWNLSMSNEELISLRDRLDETLQKIRNERNIIPSMMWCPKCQKRHRSAPPKVSVRAMILALRRFKIASETEVKALEKQWKKYMKENDLDLYGKRKHTRNFKLIIGGKYIKDE